MNISAPLQLGTNRRNVWCLSSEITSNGDGTYRFINLDKSKLGFGSKVYVIDVPALVFYFDDNSGKLYSWTETDTTQTITVNTASGSIGINATTTTVNYDGTFINAYALENNTIVACDISVTLSSVTFTVKNKPSTALTCVVVYG